MDSETRDRAGRRRRAASAAAGEVSAGAGGLPGAHRRRRRRRTAGRAFGRARSVRVGRDDAQAVGVRRAARAARRRAVQSHQGHHADGARGRRIATWTPGSRWAADDYVTEALQPELSYGVADQRAPQPPLADPAPSRRGLSWRPMGESPKITDPLEALSAARELFEEGEDFTIGVEEEFAILDPQTLDMTPGFERFAAAARARPAGRRGRRRADPLRGRDPHTPVRDVRAGGAR